MGALESKKIIILRVLYILEQYSSMDCPLTYNRILEYLKKDFDVNCERKTIGRNISFLKEAEYPIVSTSKGVYIDNKLFEEAELRLLIDSVLASRHINNKYSIELIDKLNSLGGHHFKERNKNIKVSDWGKCNNIGFFLNIEMIDEAIEANKQIEFVYNSYGKDMKLHPCKSYPYVVNPYHMMLNNQRYYLICNVDKYDNIINFRVDRITDIRILDSHLKPAKSLPDHRYGINIAKISCESPYMYTGEKKQVEMLMDAKFINDIIDWFGNDFIVEEIDNNRIKVYLKANIESMRYWALQYGVNIEIIRPESLRQNIINDIKIMTNKYKVT